MLVLLVVTVVAIFVALAAADAVVGAVVVDVHLAEWAVALFVALVVLDRDPVKGCIAYDSVDVGVAVFPFAGLAAFEADQSQHWDDWDLVCYYLKETMTFVRDEVYRKTENRIFPTLNIVI